MKFFTFVVVSYASATRNSPMKKTDNSGLVVRVSHLSIEVRRRIPTGPTINSLATL